MYIQHVREAAERYMQHMYTNENYLQNIHSNIHVRINNSHGKKFLLVNTMQIYKKQIQRLCEKKTQKIKKTKPKKPKNKSITQKKKKKICSQKKHESFVDQ